MGISWKDFAVACIIWAAVFIFLYSTLMPFQYSFPPHGFDSMVLTFLISSSASQAFYLIRNGKTSYKEAFAIAFLIPFIISLAYLIFYLFITPEMALGHQMIVISHSDYFFSSLLLILMFSMPLGLLGIFWKVILEKILKQ